MSYQFTGFFARHARSALSLVNLPTDAIIREIEQPFTGIGINLPSIAESPSADQILDYARSFNIIGADSWVFLTYSCWAGSVEYVYGMAVSGGIQLGPFEGEDEVGENTYSDIMSHFGIPLNQLRYFSPFERGFWGDVA